MHIPPTSCMRSVASRSVRATPAASAPRFGRAGEVGGERDQALDVLEVDRLDRVDPSREVASGLVNVTQQLGGTLGVAVPVTVSGHYAADAGVLDGAWAVAQAHHVFTGAAATPTCTRRTVSGA